MELNAKEKESEEIEREIEKELEEQYEKHKKRPIYIRIFDYIFNKQKKDDDTNKLNSLKDRYFELDSSMNGICNRLSDTNFMYNVFVELLKEKMSNEWLDALRRTYELAFEHAFSSRDYVYRKWEKEYGCSDFNRGTLRVSETIGNVCAILQLKQEDGFYELIEARLKEKLESAKQNKEQAELGLKIAKNKKDSIYNKLSDNAKKVVDDAKNMDIPLDYIVRNFLDPTFKFYEDANSFTPYAASLALEAALETSNITLEQLQQYGIECPEEDIKIDQILSQVLEVLEEKVSHAIKSEEPER